MSYSIPLQANEQNIAVVVSTAAMFTTRAYELLIGASLIDETGIRLK